MLVTPKSQRVNREANHPTGVREANHPTGVRVLF